MLQTLIIGLGRAGTRLHLPALAAARSAPDGAELFDPGPATAVDPAWTAERFAARGSGPRGAVPTGVVLADSLDQARARLDPEHTVVHVCTPPAGRADLVEQLAALGFSRLLLEKPLADGADEAARVEAVAALHGLRITVVAQWLSSALTARLVGLVRSERFGPLRTVRVVQRKARFDRSLAAGPGLPTAFDVEAPHAVGVALRLAGPAELVAASAADLVVGARVLRQLGGARLCLRHIGGVESELISDLTAPVRERRIELGFEHGAAVGHYPVSADDCHARLSIDAGDGFDAAEIFPDEALSVFFRETYRGFGGPGGPGDTDAGFALAVESVRLLDQAKRWSTAAEVAA